MRETIALALLCLLITLVSLAAIVATLFRGELLTLDGLLLTTICLTIAAIFSFFFGWLLYTSPWGEKLKRRGRGNPGEAKTRNE